ncbi:cell division protein FtsZ [Candidatus Kuenenbacteria bacterium]|nr:cell division protein FtsZ [Candidatus Kuenenbacteria bacterium]
MVTTKQSKIKKKTIEVKPDIETFAKIKVVGVGGGGNSAVNRMVTSDISGVDFVSVNTDAQALHQNLAKHKLHIGRTVTRGLGAGMNPELGMKSAEESSSEIREVLKGSDMVFITCGLGGGTGTGAAPVIAEIARDIGALTVAVVTRPFSFEGAQRRTIADKGLEELGAKVDTIISIPNDRILQIIDKKTSLLDAFAIVDDVLKQGVKGISDLITKPGLINVDFADVKAIMKESGSALMGIGQGSGENRAVDAAKSAIDSPLLELSIEGAKGVLFTITGPSDLTMNEVNEAARLITASVDSGAKIIFGTTIDNNLKGEVSVTVIATGFGEDAGKRDSKFGVPNTFINPLQTSSPVFIAKINKDLTSPAKTASDNTSEPKERPTRPSPKDITEDDGDEFGIPTFIRRKMK